MKRLRMSLVFIDQFDFFSKNLFTETNPKRDYKNEILARRLSYSWVNSFKERTPRPQF